MKTPYDGALRVQQRAIDDVRVAINIEVSQLVQVESSARAVEAAVVRESQVAADDPMMSTFAYVSRMRAERVRLDQEGKVIAGRLDRLRAEAVAAYGSFKAIDGAAGRYRAEEERAVANAEQARADDFSGAAFLRARQMKANRAGNGGR